MAEKKKILLVEDEKDLAEMFSLKLQDSGYEVKNAFDGQVGYDEIKRGRFDLILLDLIIPEMDGYAVLEKIRQEKTAQGALIYVWSNLTQKTEVERAMKLGAKGFLVKSDYTPTKLVDKVNEILKLKIKS